jgi:hypothetical protein
MFVAFSTYSSPTDPFRHSEPAAKNLSERWLFIRAVLVRRPCVAILGFADSPQNDGNQNDEKKMTERS